MVSTTYVTVRASNATDTVIRGMINVLGNRMSHLVKTCSTEADIKKTYLTQESSKNINDELTKKITQLNSKVDKIEASKIKANMSRTNVTNHEAKNPELLIREVTLSEKPGSGYIENMENIKNRYIVARVPPGIRDGQTRNIQFKNCNKRIEQTLTVTGITPGYSFDTGDLNLNVNRVGLNLFWKEDEKTWYPCGHITTRSIQRVATDTLFTTDQYICLDNYELTDSFSFNAKINSFKKSKDKQTLLYWTTNEYKLELNLINHELLCDYTHKNGHREVIRTKVQDVIRLEKLGTKLQLNKELSKTNVLIDDAKVKLYIGAGNSGKDAFVGTIDKIKLNEKCIPLSWINNKQTIYY
jgi:hypothetical protein